MATRERAAALLCALLLQLGVAASAGAAEQTLPPVDPPFAAPDFTLEDYDGTAHHLSDYRGQVVVLNFWATWCPPCRLEMPSMERAWQKVKDRGIVFLGVNVGEDEDTIFAFTGSYPVTFPLLMDRDGAVIKSYPAVGLPTTYIISPDGMVTHRTVGSRDWDDPAIIDRLRAMRRHSASN